jgi:hypothetical protein
MAAVKASQVTNNWSLRQTAEAVNLKREFVRQAAIVLDDLPRRQFYLWLKRRYPSLADHFRVAGTIY